MQKNINTDTKDLFVGIDLGGTFVKIGCFSEKMEMLSKISIPTDNDRPKATMNSVVNALGSLLSQAGLRMEDIKAAGIGCPGVLDTKKGMIITSPNLPVYKGFSISRYVSEKINAPCILENDANVAGWGEYVLGAAEDVDDMVLLTLGTGIGGAVITDGKLIHGAGNSASELGHIIIYPEGRECGCTQRGCAETYASASATAKRANEMLAEGAASSLQDIFIERGDVSCKEVYEHASQGDRFAYEITELTAKVIGLLCVNIFSYSNPDKIVFSGGMIAAGQALLDRISFYFNKFIRKDIDVKIEFCFANLREDSGIIGSAALARDTFCLV
ncbi:Glucokinase [Sedimentisphaera cyanobacteriorum]|uniref:Glucokinase n=1 Tax=Sedimentisphaera cyanobacteriorum TaxID=1940790 RepID=A0A1Q2HNJ9_9BACT|nr:ROK family protein [Sedimentisphaera cyanobacteriorum]AQQ08834.1 Glucokinase [Sedimentisphaera cyanobacteriorum]